MSSINNQQDFKSLSKIETQVIYKTIALSIVSLIFCLVLTISIVLIKVSIQNSQTDKIQNLLRSKNFSKSDALSKITQQFPQIYNLNIDAFLSKNLTQFISLKLGDEALALSNLEIDLEDTADISTSLKKQSLVMQLEAKNDLAPAYLIAALEDFLELPLMIDKCKINYKDADKNIFISSCVLNLFYITP